VLVARLLCSDPACAEEIAAEARTLRELEVLACECGCGLEVIGFPDRVEEAELVVLRGERADELPAAA
jgi:hypothetical protein